VFSLVYTLVDGLKKVYLDRLIRMVKVQAAIVYLEGIKRARRILILLCLLIFTITLIGAGFVLIPLALLIFMPWEPQTKAIVGIAIGAVYLLAPLVGIAFVLSEKRWMSVTGARDTLDKLVE
jgi:uncharacterized membrane protein YqjE